MMIVRVKVPLLLGVIALDPPIPPLADAIIPYMAVPWGQVVLLPVVILIEGVILDRLVGGPAVRAVFHSFLANIVSTVLGAALYLAAMPVVGGRLFQWWFKGGLFSEAIRNASIALGFAVVLWPISWASETAVVARLRRTTFKSVARAVACANVVTYILLLGLALVLQG